MIEPEDMPDIDREEFDKVAKAMGLYPKYDVIKRETGELVTDPVFVLNPQTDPIALVVLDLYAGLALMDGYTELANDINHWTHRIKHDGRPTLEGVEEWATRDFLGRLRLAKARIEINRVKGEAEQIFRAKASEKGETS